MSLTSDDPRLYCKVYVQTDMSLRDLVMLVTEELNGNVDRQSVLTSGLELYIDRNEEFDPTMIPVFPDGFLYFRYYLDVFPSSTAFQGMHIERIGHLLEALWARGIPAVAACDYEDVLPKKGGYKNRTTPWPKSRYLSSC